MFASNPEYPDRHSIPIAFNLDDPEQAELLRAFNASFGEHHRVLENLDPPRYLCLTVLPGGAREDRR